MSDKSTHMLMHHHVFKCFEEFHNGVQSLRLDELLPGSLLDRVLIISGVSYYGCVELRKQHKACQGALIIPTQVRIFSTCLNKPFSLSTHRQQSAFYTDRGIRLSDTIPYTISLLGSLFSRIHIYIYWYIMGR